MSNALPDHGGLSYLFLTLAAAHLGLWVWGWQRWSQAGRPVALLLVLVAATLLSYDNLRLGVGRFLGPGETLQALSVPAFVWHWSMLPLLVIAAGSVARAAGLDWARPKAVMGLFCLAAVGLAAHDIPKIFDLDLRVACLADTVRYTTTVPADQLCGPGEEPWSSSAGAPVVAIVTNLVVLGVGIALWVAHRWPWLALGAAAMFLAAGAFAGSAWALPVANAGELVFTLGLIVTAVRFGRPARRRG